MALKLLNTLPSILTQSLVIKYYKMRGGIEAMFRDYKSGGYNLEGSKANIHRLTNLILLIAITKNSLIQKNGKFWGACHINLDKK